MKYVLTIFSLLFILESCSSSQQVESLKKARITPTNITNVINLEKKFAENYYTSAPENVNWFEYKEGKKNILIVAGHATAQSRNDYIKQPDAGTGSIALEINKLANVPCLYTTYLCPSDPNYYDDNAFKDSLALIVDKIKPILVIDLHGSHPYRPYDVDFGTMNGKSYLHRYDLFDKLKSIFKAQGFINQSQDYFAAEKNQTVTKFLYKKGIPCIQLEVNSNYYSAELGNNNAQKTAQLLQALLFFIEEVDH